MAEKTIIFSVIPQKSKYFAAIVELVLIDAELHFSCAAALGRWYNACSSRIKLSLAPTMICNPYEIIIQGITSNGREFRPSDWAERLSGILSTFGVDQKLSYAPFVRPMVHNNVRCVAVDRQLEKVDPRVFEFIMTFAKDNDLQVVDCRSLIQGNQH
jgi:hypothetical protein